MISPENPAALAISDATRGHPWRTLLLIIHKQQKGKHFTPLTLQRLPVDVCVCVCVCVGICFKLLNSQRDDEYRGKEREKK